MRAYLLSFAVLLAVGISGCTTSEDPAQGGFLSGISNLSNGTYQNRIDERQKTLEDEQDKNVQQSRAAERLAAQSADVKAQREAAEAKYADFQKSLQASRNKLAAAQKANSKKKADVTALNRDIDSLEKKIKLLQQDTFTPDTDKQKRLDDLRKEREALEREVDLLVRR